jgi:hypothetical protein
MIASALRIEIDRYAMNARQVNPLYRAANAGSFTTANLRSYLVNIHRLVCHTPIHLVQARDRARDLGDERLAVHFENKRLEEQGHDAWAERDLARTSTTSTFPPPQIVSSMNDLLEYLRNTIDRDPVLYLAYVLFAEYVTVLVGDEWLGLLETNCGIPRSGVSVVGNHVELDREHVEHALDEIDALVGDPRKLPELRAVLLDTFRLFDRFCADVTRERISDTRLEYEERATSAA